jgi:hypothetical protein
VAERKHAPSDLELMRFFDGELDDDEREAEIEAWLEEDDAHDGRDKLADLGLVAGIVAEEAMARAADIDLVDAVMDGLDEAEELEGAADAEAEVVELPRPVARERAELPEVAGAASGAAGSSRAAGSSHAAANDNARSIYGLAAVAAAIAAGLFFWGRSDPTAELAHVPARPPIEETVVAPAATPAAPEALADAVAEEDEDPTVEVAAVDFGSNSGSVFYVSGDENAAATAVVWITDDAGEEP